MRKVAIVIAAFVLFSVFGFAMTSAAATTPTVAVDLAHGENPKGLLDVTYKNKTLTAGILNTIKDMKFVYFGDAKYEEELGIKSLGGKITADALKGVDILIIGQPTSPFYPDEVQAIKQWLSEGGHVLWIAGDSDYGSGAKSQQFVDSLLDQLGITNLRVDLCSVEDPVSNAQKSYRVVALVKPSPDTPGKDMITKGFEHEGKVLEHGPGVVAWVDDNGNWHPLTDKSKPKNAYIIVRTTENGQIVENNAPAANAYQAGDQGSFPIVAVQIVKLSNNKKPDVIIVSGETPIGGYTPMWVSQYYNVPLDGPHFVTNLLHGSVEMTKGVTTSSSAPAKTTSSTTSSKGGICGPAFIVGLAALPLLLRRRK